MTSPAWRSDSLRGEVSAIVLHYRNWPGVISTIESLQSQTVPVSITLVDNASGDGSADQIRTAFPDVHVIEAPSNGGYAAGMNLGRGYAASANILFVTHEVVLEHDVVQLLAESLVDDVGLVGPLLMDLRSPETVFSSGGFISPNGLVGHYADIPTAARDVDWLDGACLFSREDVLGVAGPIDEGYFMYFEETDLAERIRSSGWRVQCIPTARAWQKPGSLPLALYTRNWLRFLGRYRGPSAVRGALRIIGHKVIAAVRQRSMRRAVFMMWGVLGYVLHLPPRYLTRRAR